MSLSLDEALIEVWCQALVDGVKVITLGTDRFPVSRTPKRGLRQVDFTFEGEEIRGLEQNPQTKSRWAQMARSGKNVMQFLSGGRYSANVVDGKATSTGDGHRSDHLARLSYWDLLDAEQRTHVYVSERDGDALC